MSEVHVSMSHIRVVAEDRRADLRVPTAAPLVDVFPTVLELLEIPAESQRRFTLVTDSSEELDMDASPHQAKLRDGSVLYLQETEAVSPPPEVYDVTTVVASDRDSHPLAWERHRGWVSALCAAVLLTVGGLMSIHHSETRNETIGVGVAAALLAAGGIMLGRAFPTISLYLLGSAVIIGGALSFDTLGAWEGSLIAGVVLAAAFLGAAVAGHLARPNIVTGSLLLALLGSIHLLHTSGVSTMLSAGIIGVVALYLMGSAPRMAVGLSGIDSLDTSKRSGERISMAEAGQALLRAHGSVAGIYLVMAPAIAVSAAVLAHDTEQRIWTFPLCLVLTVALALRAQSVPMLPERLAISFAAVGAVLGITSAELSGDHHHWALAALVGLAGVVLLLTSVSWKATQGAQFRIWVRRVELLCALASVPLALGMTGLYGDLLDTF